MRLADRLRSTRTNELSGVRRPRVLDYIEGFALMVGALLALVWALYIPGMLASVLVSAAVGDPAPPTSAPALFGPLLLAAPFLVLAWTLHTGRPWSRHLMLVLAAVPLLAGAPAGLEGLAFGAALVGAIFWLLYLCRPVDDWYRLLDQRQASEHEARRARRQARIEHEQRRAERRP